METPSHPHADPKTSLLAKLARLKTPSPAVRARVLALIQQEKPRFLEVQAKLSPRVRDAFRQSFDGEMGRILDAPE